MKPGVYQMERAEYDALPYYNQSLIKKWISFGSLPSEFKYFHDHPGQPSDSLILGSALDCAMLEPARYHARFSAAPRCDRRTKIGKELWQSFQSECNGKTVITDEQSVHIQGMAESLRKSDSVSDVFKFCRRAVLIANIFGFNCKGEIDFWSEKSAHIGDLKALKDVSPSGFMKAFFDFGYDIQATFYLALARALGFDKRIFDFHCVKNAPPHTVATYSFAPFENEGHRTVEIQAENMIGQAIGELDRRIKTNDFADDHDWKLIAIPQWRLRRAQIEIEATE